MSTLFTFFVAHFGWSYADGSGSHAARLIADRLERERTPEDLQALRSAAVDFVAAIDGELARRGK